MPARTDVASATIIASASIDCDGYSTAALMLGMDEGPAFVEGIDGVEGVFISDADEVRWTSALPTGSLWCPRSRAGRTRRALHRRCAPVRQHGVL